MEKIGIFNLNGHTTSRKSPLNFGTQIFSNIEFMNYFRACCKDKGTVIELIFTVYVGK
jgi:hypothetical protein